MLTGNAVGANIQNLSQSRLSNVILAIPSIEKQNRINDYYNKLYRNRLIEDEEKKIGSVKDIKNKLKEEKKQ